MAKIHTPSPKPLSIEWRPGKEKTVVDRCCMVFEMHDAMENFFAFRMRARDEVVSVEKSKMLTLNMLSCFARSTETKDPCLMWQLGIAETE